LNTPSVLPFDKKPFSAEKRTPVNLSAWMPVAGMPSPDLKGPTMKLLSKGSRIWLLFAVGVAVWTTACVDFASGAEDRGDEAAPYLAAVRQFADQALKYGRDTYGKPTPLFVDGINVDTREPLKWKWADGKEWVLCNLATQQGLFRTLDGLSRLTGDPRYKDAAVEATRYAFDHLRYGTENNGGLLAWGGHLAYNATDDTLAGNPDGSGRVHELKCFFPHYQLMWEADPKATQQIIENMWSGHVLDWSRLDFNRHGSPKKPGLLWKNEYRGGEVFFWGKGLTFHNAGCDFYYAAGMLTKLAGDPDPLVWAKRLSQRYVETRDPKTGLEGYQFSQCKTAWCDDTGKICGDRAQYQYGDDFPGHHVVEGTLFPCYGNTPLVEPQIARLLLGEALGEQGRDFTRQAVETMTAWGKSAYRSKDNTFIPMLTDGTSLEGYVCKKDGYFGPKGNVIRAGHPGSAHLWAYAMAHRLSGDAFMWEMARNIARGNGWGDIGQSPAAAPQFRLPAGASDPFLLCALLELHRRGRQPAFLEQAQGIGRNIIAQRVHKGWFVPSQRNVYCSLSNDESQALLQLAAALMHKPEVVPAFTGASPFFHAQYGASTGRVYDKSSVYRKTR
jgi:pectate lyase